jgi:GT2 family glycosyltransferase
MFSVVIPTCRRNAQLAFCLERLKPGAQTLPAGAFEVIVTDDGPGQEARDFVGEHYPWVLYTPGPGRGPAANRNHGAALATGDWLVFTDDDCLPDSNWLQAYADAIKEHPECKAFEGAILPDDWELLKEDMAECPVNEKGGCFWSANIMIDRVFMNLIGGFDESFKIAANEDQELFYRVTKKTIVAFVQDAKVQHPVRLVTLSKKLFLLHKSEASQILLMRKRGYSPLSNYFNGIIIHVNAFISAFKLGHFRRMAYNLIGVVYRIAGYNFLESFIHSCIRNKEQRH